MNPFELVKIGAGALIVAGAFFLAFTMVRILSS
jgi:hypothetical protein